MPETQDPTARAGLPPWAVVTPSRAAHVQRVVALLESWADRLSLDDHERGRWLQAAWLHDALRDADESLLRSLLPLSGDPLPFLHGPAAAVMADRHGVMDEDVLDAVRWHTTGNADWGIIGRALYAADFLEPGREFLRDERAQLAEQWPLDPNGVLRLIVTLRDSHQAARGRTVHPMSAKFTAAVLG